jgi:deazaflavin-dependent oxidoreductase (nitroreductase family)
MTEAHGTTGEGKRPTLPPNWFIRTAWAVHRAVFRLTGGRRGLWRATPEKWGTIRLHTVGRTSGKERIAILGYHDDGPNIVTVAMNGWMEGDPAWWLNLQAKPDATIELKGQTLRVRARAAAGEERERLWKLFPDAQPFVAHRKTETAIVVLEPQPDGA